MAKDISELNLPDDVRYTEDHEWAQQEGDAVKVGITDYAQDQLGDIVFVELPEPGETFGKGDEFGTLESVKAVSELFMPIDGEILAVNEALEDAPELVNSEPYGGGWMVKIKPDDSSALDALMDKAAYLNVLKG
jgi:glycine cleavage system H protein